MFPPTPDSRVRRLWPAGLPALLLVACVSGPPRPTLAPAYELALAELESEQARVARSVELPVELEFAEYGQLTVRDFSLDGFPGNTYLRARFVYTNTTGRQLRHVTIWLDILDPSGRQVASQASFLSMPYALPFGPETMFADELRSQTLGVHRLPGWSWRYRCEAVFEDG